MKIITLSCLVIALTILPAVAKDECLTSIENAVQKVQQEIAHISVQGRALSPAESDRLQRLRKASELLFKAKEAIVIAEEKKVSDKNAKPGASGK